jgi:methylglutaconyl-CoA hydratase
MYHLTLGSAPLALRAAKQAISRSGDLSLEAGNRFDSALHKRDSSFSVGLDFERTSYEILLASKDRTEALEAFKDKRRPVFKGE